MGPSRPSREQQGKGRGRKGPAFDAPTERKSATRESRNRLLVCCGALRTEGDYLRGLRDRIGNPAVTVKFKAKACSPSQLVSYAIAEQERQSGEFDQVWCVFDVDQYPDVGDAVKEAGREGIAVALSNPCFELWLILHFATHTAPAGTYKELLPTLKRHLAAYDKTHLRFRDYEDGWAEAVRRAKKLAEPDQEHLRNPSTGVWRLVEEITGSAGTFPAQRGGSSSSWVRSVPEAYDPYSQVSPPEL
jgi:hypothetical protein